MVWDIIQDMIDGMRMHIAENTEVFILSVVILLVGIIVIKIITRSLKRFFDRVNFPPTIEIYIQRVARIMFYLILLAIILSNIGFDVTGYIAGLGIIGIVIGFALKDVLGNFAAGVIILIVQPFRIGDRVVTSGIEGIVKIMGMSCCIIITDTDEYVTIPNNRVWGSPIRNLSRLKKEKKKRS